MSNTSTSAGAITVKHTVRVDRTVKSDVKGTSKTKPKEAK